MAKFLCILALISCVQIHWRTCTAEPENDFYCGLAGADLRRSSFPSNFIFGVTTSNYQYEGAINEGGKGPSNFDSFAHVPGNIIDGSNADVAEDHYHRYKEDIQLMKDLGVDASRFSISWSRIFPGVEHVINKEGIAHYNDVIDNLLENGIKPVVTLNHLDIPQALEKAYGGWLSTQIIEDFAIYANTCFKAFGDRVKVWVTINEPHESANGAYNVGLLPPQRCSKDVGNCTLGDSSIEPYIVGHHYLLAHAAAANLYRKYYKSKQHGYVGISLDSRWFEPITSKIQDEVAAQRALEFELGWFLDPLYYGHYPHKMRSEVGNRLPKFTKEESLAIKGSLDFLGLNYYSAVYATDMNNKDSDPSKDIRPVAYYKDTKFQLTAQRNGEKIGPEIDEVYVAPWGIKKLLEYIKLRYNNPIVVITENGVGDGDMQFTQEVMYDVERIDYLNGHLSCLLVAIRNGSNVAGYFTWSLLDNWEWIKGFSIKYGLYHVDRNTLQRYPKQSAYWFKTFLERESHKWQ